MRCALLLGLTLVASTAPAGELPAPEQYKLRVEYQEWRPDLSAELRSGLLGTRLDLKDDLGIEDERTFEVRGALQLASGFKIRGSVTPLDYLADVRIDRTFVFNGRVYPVSARVVSEVNGKLYSAHLEFDFLKTPAGYLGVMIGGELFDGRASIAAPQFGLSEAEELNTPVPVVGATGRLYVGRLSFEGELTGLTIGERGHTYELRFGARFHIVEHVAVGAGYRLFKIEGQDDPDFVDFRQGGLTFGAELSL